MYKIKTTAFKNIKLRLQPSCFVACLVLLVCPLHPSWAADPVFAPAPCDPDYYESLEARAWLEAQREITQNQNLIVKPDSVLDYTCFDSHLDQLALAADPGANALFSGNTTWGTNADMQQALGGTNAAYGAYHTANFDHKYLGGRAGGPYAPGVVNPAAYTCEVMNNVWEDAKCMDFIDEPSHDGFFTFADYEADPKDKRILPAECPAKPNFQQRIDTAVVDASTPWNEDLVESYFYLLHRDAGDYCGNTTDNDKKWWRKSKVRTGLQIKRDNSSAYNEYICLVPGCYYKPAGGNDPDSGSCERP
ncbi:MAG: hypothetical protein KDI46_09115 [Alphaproteobacteria bacterium]|nr:hypothetical protein [Alphaproteobacteria bacterium]